MRKRKHTQDGVTYTSHELHLSGVWMVQRTPHTDERGEFDRLYDPALLALVVGAHLKVAQLALVKNPAEGTLRGLHYQLPPCQEQKLVWAMRGSVLDVVLDLRAGSPTWGKAAQVQLQAGDGRGVYVPPGCAHGYLTMEPDSWVQYATSAPYSPEHARGVHWLAAQKNWWPGEVRLVSERDEALPCQELQLQLDGSYAYPLPRLPGWRP